MTGLDVPRRDGGKRLEQKLETQASSLKGELGPKLLLPMGCVKLGEKNCVHLPSVGEKPQINYPISRNPWELIISGPVQ